MNTTRSMFDDLSGALAGDGASARRVIDKEAVLDTTEFLTELLTQQTSLEEAEEARMQLRVCDELESVSDYAKRVYKMHQKLNDKGFTFSEKQKQDFATLHEKVVRFFDILIAIKLDRENEQLMQDSEELRVQINQDVASFREEHWASLETTPVLPVISTTYTDVLQAYKRTKNHMHNIVESYIGER
jgi:phosphate:Na+ symporter